MRWPQSFSVTTLRFNLWNSSESSCTAFVKLLTWKFSCKLCYWIQSRTFSRNFQASSASLQLELGNNFICKLNRHFHDFFHYRTVFMKNKNSIRISLVKTAAPCFPTLAATFLVTYFAFIQLLCGVLNIFWNIKFFFLQALFLYFLHSVSECFSFFWNFIWTDCKGWKNWLVT